MGSVLFCSFDSLFFFIFLLSPLSSLLGIFLFRVQQPTITTTSTTREEKLKKKEGKKRVHTTFAFFFFLKGQGQGRGTLAQGFSRFGCHVMVHDKRIGEERYVWQAWRENKEKRRKKKRTKEKKKKENNKTKENCILRWWLYFACVFVSTIYISWERDKTTKTKKKKKCKREKKTQCNNANKTRRWEKKKKNKVVYVISTTQLSLSPSLPSSIGLQQIKTTTSYSLEMKKGPRTHTNIL